VRLKLGHGCAPRTTVEASLLYLTLPVGHRKIHRIYTHTACNTAELVW